MRRARGIRVPAAQNVCVFCATRLFAPAGASHSSIALPQRRLLNSSSKAPQYAPEAQLYMEKREPGRQTSPRFPSGPQSFQRQQPQSQQPAPQRGSGFFDAPSRNQNNERFAPGRDGPRQSGYTVKMGSRPPPMDLPHFNSTANLRRRNDVPGRRVQPTAERGSQWQAQIQTQTETQIQERPPPLRPKLDQEELARLLDNNSIHRKRETQNSYTPLSRDTRALLTCFHCGEEGHSAFECPSKPAGRQPSRFGQQRMAPQTTRESVKDAAESWIRSRGAETAESQAPAQFSQVEQAGGRRKTVDTAERRRSRFIMEDHDLGVETRNRYEEPERRRRGGGEKRARGRIMREEDEEEEERHISKAERKRKRAEMKKAAQLAKEEPTPISIPEYISVANLATLLKLRVEDFITKLEELGFEDVQNDHILNAEHAGLVAQEYNFEPVLQVNETDADLYPAEALSPEEYAKLPARPPVVTIMGHVDHGKTTILDYMRNSSVAATEFGGITQHIGAFSVPLSSGKTITFLDTPGHAAFETMRARGANVTDIVVLVVAADDSVMPQTVEAIKHAQAAKVPIIVAINKIDKQQADVERVKLDLGRHGVDVEDFGGDVQAICVSGKTGKGISDLEEAIALQSEVLDHRADPQANVEGWVLEGTTKKSGRVATVLVRSGTLRRGDCLVAGNTWTHVKSLRNEAGVVVEEARPGMPVEVDGWREQPVAGDEVLQAADEEQASEVAELRQEKVKQALLAKDMDAINESRRLEAKRREAEEAAKKTDEAPAEATKQETGPELVSFIVKADVSGSVEAVVDSLSAIGNNEVGARILRYGVGPPSEFDVQHAADAKGHIVNFNTEVPSHISQSAAAKGVQILDSNIIYRVVEDVKALLSDKLAPKITQRVTGEAEIAAVFDIGLGGKKKLKVAGSKVRNGFVLKGTKVKVLRGEEVVFDGILSSLKSQKKDVDQMRKDTECGIAFQDWEEFEVGDKVQCYEEKSEKRTL